MRSSLDLKARLMEMGLEPKRAFGQNFLINHAIIAKIVEAAQARPYRSLIEIGPGLGALTEPLLALGTQPQLVELDADLVKYWRGRGMNVVDADALKVDWTTLVNLPGSLLVSNLPYQISTHLVIDRCLGPVTLKWMILMFQKEVAERLTAKPRTKDYGLLSVMAQLHFKMTKIADASPGDFFPAPKVASRVLAFERREPVDSALGEHFLKFLKAGFAFRRKFLLKNVKGLVDKSRESRLPEALQELGFDGKARAEELSPEDWAGFYKRVYEH